MPQFSLPQRLWTPSPNYSARSTPVRLVVVHDCEGSEQGAIATFANSESQVSAHAVLSADGSRMTCMVDWANKAWACCAFNSLSDNIEMPGFAAAGYSDVEWDAMAAVVAWRCKVRGLPPVWTKDADKDAGFTSHFYLGSPGGGHTDPTTDLAKWQEFCARVAAAYSDVPASEFPLGPQVAPQSAPAGFVPSAGVRHDLEIGSVAWAQAQLNKWRAPAVPIAVDNMVGSATRGWLKSFQATHHLQPDGVLGPLTIAALKTVE